MCICVGWLIFAMNFFTRKSMCILVLHTLISCFVFFNLFAHWPVFEPFAHLLFSNFFAHLLVFKLFAHLLFSHLPFSNRFVSLHIGQSLSLLHICCSPISLHICWSSSSLHIYCSVIFHSPIALYLYTFSCSSISFAHELLFKLFAHVLQLFLIFVCWTIECSLCSFTLEILLHSLCSFIKNVKKTVIHVNWILDKIPIKQFDSNRNHLWNCPGTTIRPEWSCRNDIQFYFFANWAQTCTFRRG